MYVLFLLPQIARDILDRIRPFLDRYEKDGLTTSQAEELCTLCPWLADLAEKSYSGIQAALQSGAEGIEWEAVWKDVSANVEESLQTCDRLRVVLTAMTASAEGKHQVARLISCRHRLEWVHRQMKSPPERKRCPPSRPRISF
jgi:hypothetical protein